MKRENRYLVFKHTDIEKYLPTDVRKELESIANIIDVERDRDDKPELNCVIVEHDCPEYEMVWKLIENRVNNKELSINLVVNTVDYRNPLPIGIENTHGKSLNIGDFLPHGSLTKLRIKVQDMLTHPDI